MKLIEFKNNELVISDEIYHVKAFKSLSEVYSNYLDILGYMYFMYHPGSDYNYIINEEEKNETICEALGLDMSDIITHQDYLDCIAIYKKMVVTTSSRILDNNRKRLDKLDIYLDDMVLDDDNIAKYTKAISDINKLAEEISKSEKEIYKDIEEQSSKVRGKVELTIGDKGL
jgi:hypothetical protein